MYTMVFIYIYTLFHSHNENSMYLYICRVDIFDYYDVYVRASERMN